MQFKAWQAPTSTSRAHWVRLAVGVSLLALAACGFHLRGQGAGLPPEFKQVVVDGQGRQAQSLHDFLVLAGAQVSRDSAQAWPRIVLEHEQDERNIASLTRSGKVAEYTLIYSVDYQVLAADKTVLLPTQHLVLRRSLTYSDSQVLAKETEANDLQNEMRQDATRQILRRLEWWASHNSGAANLGRTERP